MIMYLKITAAFVTSIFLMLTAPLNAAEKKNVLFIISDDLNNSLGCYGHPLAKTPNLDALAKRGVKFDRAYCQFPLCSPSRTSFLTGRRPDSNGVKANPGQPNKGKFGGSPHFRETIPNTVTMPQLFINNGYSVARVGKLYHYNVPNGIGTSGLDDPQSWEKVINPKGRDVDDEPQIFTLTKGQFGATLSWLAAEGKDEEQTDGIGATEAIKLLTQMKEKPFFLAVGLYRPHTPYVAPKKYFELYPLDKISLPVVDPDHKKGVPAAAFLSFKKDEEQLTDDLRKKATQAYLASISFMDAQVGRIINELDRLKLGDDTLIVFTSDHGYHMGEHGLWQKRSIFEESARVPLIIVDPKSKSINVSSPRTVEMLDIYPTLADLCGLKYPDYLDGKSLKPLLEDPKAPWDRPAITQTVLGKNINGYTIRNERYRYTEWNQGKDGVQLYDHDTDPKELKNLANDPTFKGTVAELSKLMRQRLGK